ncbi:hypothetical protein FF100_21305 [Methylobacterium terricola]|uniref:Uncharacterized protein n=1 Tax=Methylobacterium terricola TaxID=2583531 RepID=A0A5C4LBY0_9HYPH|nr:hypothetical protein [Methylobacterium terricola]TNC10702.1 hypothetical protein FF100_21305 [Methylobacterium terricola]
MGRIFRLAKKWKGLALPCALSIAAVCVLPNDFIAIVSGELINFFGFVIAAVLPAMALTATTLRGSGMSVRRLMQLRDALDLQMKFWAGLVLYSFAAVALIVVAKPWIGCAAGATCTPQVLVEYKGFALDTRVGNGATNAAVAFLFGSVFFQLFNVVGGLRALLRVNAEAAIGEAQQRFDDRFADVDAHIARVKNPPGFGETVELPSMPDAGSGPR